MGYTATASAIDAAINKKTLGSGTTTLIVSSDEMEDILKIVKSLEDSGILLKGVSETIKDQAKHQRDGFLSMLLGTLDSALLTDILLGKKDKGVIRAGYGSKGQGTIRAGYGSNRSSLKKFWFHDILMGFILEIICLKNKRRSIYN